MNEHQDARSFPPGISENSLIRFELTTGFSGSVPDRKATGKIRYYSGSAYTLSTTTYDFYDANGDLDGASGDKGYARFFRDSNRLEILTKEC